MTRCSNCELLKQEIETLKEEITLLKKTMEMPPSYSTLGVPFASTATGTTLFDLSDPSNVTSVTLVHGFIEQFSQKFPMQFKLYNFQTSRDSGSAFIGKGADTEKGIFSINGIWHDSLKCTMTFTYKDLSTEYKGVVDWKASTITGSYNIPPWTISGGDPFRFTFFSI